jgi:hypothetical protein
MSVITIRGQMGSGAQEIGMSVALKLNISYVDREIIDKVARKLKLTKEEVAEKEMPPSEYSNALRGFVHYLSGSPRIPDVGLPVWEIPLNEPVI